MDYVLIDATVFSENAGNETQEECDKAMVAAIGIARKKWQDANIVIVDPCQVGSMLAAGHISGQHIWADDEIYEEAWMSV